MDARINYLFNREMQGDKSFTEKPLFGIFGTKYSQTDMKETWRLGIKHGIEIGLRNASIEGQILELNNNTKTKSKREIEFIEKRNTLYEEYGYGIQYHPIYGMVVVDFGNFKNK